MKNAYFGSSEPRKAIEYYEQQLTICREINDQRGEGNALWNSALVYEALGERRQALSLMQLALGISEAIEDPNVAQVREKLAQWQGVVDAV